MPDHVDVPEPPPLDTDLLPESEPRTQAAQREPTKVAAQRRAGASVDPLVVLAVFAGGLAGGATRYEIGVHWRSAGAFPWPTFVINVTGAFVLALLLVLVIDVFPPTRFVRPALGTGFLGAYTTFSSLVVAADELAAHGHAVTAVVYVVSSALCGVLLALAGVSAGRWIAIRRRHRRRA